MYKMASSGFFCTVILLFFALSFAHAQAKDTLAILPFTGGQGEDGETIAELFSFQRDLTALFSPVPRTSITRAIRGEQGFQMGSGMTDPDTIAALGKQLGAAYVVAGTIARLGSRNLLIIALLHTENLQQIAGDMQTYTTIEEIDAKLPAMARNIAAAVGADTSRLPLLALPPVQLADGADSREADALAQILAARLLRSGKYAVYPRTKSLEQVQEEYGSQFNGDTADEYLPNIGMATNPRLVLSVTARRLGAVNMFNASVINLETGAQEAGGTVDYQSLEDGIDAMDDLVRKLTGQETQAAEAERAAQEQLAAEVERAVQERLAEVERAVQERLAEAERAVQERLAEAERTAQEQLAAEVERAAQERLVEAERAAQERLAAEAARHNLTAGDSASFTRAVAVINNDTAGGQYTITLNGSFNSNPVALAGNVDKTITIKGDSRVRTITNNGAGALFLSSGVGALFTVPELITLVLDNNITLDGNNQNNRIVYVNGGSLVMKSGSTARGAKSAAGVVVENKGVFTMSGGTISGNTYGGVRVISGNFTMTGGTINGNSTSAGGGVNVDGGAFTMSGGTISGNTAEEGGGVCLNSGAFRMTGGTISGNSAAGVLLTKGGGGGVMVNSGAFTMSGGTISGNTASARGGGVEVYGGTFNKSGGGAIDNTNRARSGRVVFISTGRNKRRKTTAGPTVNLDSSVSGNAGGWE